MATNVLTAALTTAAHGKWRTTNPTAGTQIRRSGTAAAVKCTRSAAAHALALDLSRLATRYPVDANVAKLTAEGTADLLGGTAITRGKA